LFEHWFDALDVQTPATLHGLAAAVGHMLVPQSPVVHVTSHRHAEEQLMLPHASRPFSQVAPRYPAPEVMSPHAFAPSHVITADPEAPVVIVPHAALPPSQTTLQPAVPHVTLPHAEPPLQVALPPPAPIETGPQLLLPLQLSVHLPVHVIELHALVVPSPSHSIAQVPDVHLTSLHAPAA
jgi:hypothetical protein